MIIRILGSGCAKCNALFHTVEKAVDALSLDVVVEKEGDISKILEYNILSTPALVINDEVVLEGKILSVEEAKQLLKKYI